MTDARYVYCIVEGSQKAQLGKIGIESNKVYTIPFQDLSAVVHNCSEKPYESKDNEVVKNWVITHEKVIEMAWEKLGTVLPFGFDTIIKADGGKDPEEIVIYWLGEDYQSLKEKLDKVKGKAEYAVQVSWDTKVISRLLTDKDEELKRLSEGIKCMSKGVAYMYRQKIEKLLRGKLEKEGEKYFKGFYRKIKEHTDEIKIEKLRAEENRRQMIMNVSCLADKKDVKALGGELDKINNLEGFFVRFTGPWPPYSFV